MFYFSSNYFFFSFLLYQKILVGKGGKTIQSIKEEAAFDIQMALGRYEKKQKNKNKKNNNLSILKCNRPVILTFEMKVSKYALAQQREYDGE